MRAKEGIIFFILFVALGAERAHAESIFSRVCARLLRTVNIESPVERLPDVIDAVVVVVKKDDRYLIGYRGVAPMKGLWGQLGGKIDAGESISQTAIREVREESGLQVKRLKFLFKTTAFLPENQKRYRIFVVEALEFEGEPKVTEPQKTPILGWFHPSMLSVPLTSASHEFFKRKGFIR